MHISRRQAIPSSAALLCGLQSAANALPARNLSFPRDHGSHNDFRTEWWYLTGWLQVLGPESKARRLIGFQITFFRSRIEAAQAVQSSLAAKHILLAHAAVSDVESATLLHADQAFRWNGEFNAATSARASSDTTDLRLRNWRLQRTASGYTAQAASEAFALDLQLQTTQSLLLQGDGGLSRKGPDAAQASYYYSQPQLAASGTVKLRGQNLQVSGKAWLDHEWSQEILHPEAVGWDWIGMNLFDGSALTAFQLRRKDGSAIWAGGSFRKAGEAHPQAFNPSEVKFTPLANRYLSAQTQASYPTAWAISTPAASHSVHALFPAQEMKRGSTPLPVYWEGISELRDAGGKAIGRGYLEMTGYAGQLRL